MGWVDCAAVVSDIVLVEALRGCRSLEVIQSGGENSTRPVAGRVHDRGFYRTRGGRVDQTCFVENVGHFGLLGVEFVWIPGDLDRAFRREDIGLLQDGIEAAGFFRVRKHFEDIVGELQDGSPRLEKRTNSHGSHGRRVSNRRIAHGNGVEVQREGILVIDNSRGEIRDVVPCKRLSDDVHALRLEMRELREKRLQPFVEVGGHSIKVDWVGLAGG